MVDLQRCQRRWGSFWLAMLAAIWWSLVISYVAAPCKLVDESEVAMALFACQHLEHLPAYLSSLSLVMCLVLCMGLVPHTALTAPHLRWDILPHSLGFVTLAAGILKACVATMSDALEFGGIITGRAAAVYLSMMLLVISRRSVLAEWHGLDYPMTIAFHRVVGWWVVAMSLIHSIAFVVFYLREGGLRELGEACLPVSLTCDDPTARSCWNTLGLVNGFGVVATTAVIILGALSREQVRRRFYDVFYYAHLVGAFVFVLFCGLHDFQMVILMFPGVVLYAKDRTVATRQHVEVAVEVGISQNGGTPLLNPI